jgi:hypothetical protein
LNAAEAFDDVRQEARLRHLAVADDVEADIGLPFDALVDGFLDLGVELVLAVRLAGDLGLDQLEQIRRTGQATDMRGEDSVGPGFHLLPPGK